MYESMQVTRTAKSARAMTAARSEVVAEAAAAEEEEEEAEAGGEEKAGPEEAGVGTGFTSIGTASSETESSCAS